ncbi:MAG: DUF3145 domain-containing protein [Tetrasphaera jenkinsii]|jgi:hypothetical protein|nr:DUF3145 domain-containing protein [Tetrasphaera jenkinsii]
MSLSTTRATTRGVVFVHATPAALCPHIEWALEHVLGRRVSMEWTDQPAAYGQKRCELSWVAAPGTGASLTSALRGVTGIRFEVTEEPSPGLNGSRWCHTPRLGLHHAWMAPNGDAMIHEGQLREIVASAMPGGDIAELLDGLLGTAWDNELEVFRYAGEGAPVRWLHKVG